MNKILVLNGPNLNLLGRRNPEIYGRDTLGDIEQMCRSHVAPMGCNISFFQTNHEGGLIDALHGAIGTVNGVVLNAGGYSHTSIAIRDAVEAIGLPTVEVHLSDIRAREEFRQVSLIEDVAFKFVCGQGAAGYLHAIDLLVDHWAMVDQRLI